MFILNFSHPFTPEQIASLEVLLGEFEIIDVPVQFDIDLLFEPQIVKLLNSIELTSKQWQTIPIVINPPSYNFIALGMIAILHSKMGHFPTIIRVRPVKDSLPTRYEIAEIIDLQQLRSSQRELR